MVAAKNTQPKEVSLADQYRMSTGHAVKSGGMVHYNVPGNMISTILGASKVFWNPDGTATVCVNGKASTADGSF